MLETNAQIYAQHRPRYPQEMIDDLRERTIGDHGGLLVDWGCGTGELSLRMSPYFDRVIAVDVDAGVVSLGKERAADQGAENVEWHVDRAEAIEIAPESCDLITCGSAFHWMDRGLLSERAVDGLKPAGAVAVMGGAGDDIWSGRKEWHRVAIECLNKYLDQSSPETKQAEKTKVRRGGKSHTQGAGPQDPKPANKWHADFLEAAGLEVESLQYPTEFAWPVDDVAGYMYSITGGLPWNLGDQRDSFEREFSEALTRLSPSGVLHETINFFLLIASKPSEG